ncbi:MAG: pectate lyase [Segetibacter sp.]|nr:pectate lyase [Segetibacter sp.]
MQQAQRGVILLCLLLSFQHLSAQRATKPPSPIIVSRGKITYNPDSIGNRVPDFSYSGYMASEQRIPNVAVKVLVPIVKGDATLRIQSALDYVASLPVDNKGFRGAVLLQKGTYYVGGQLQLKASGIVLRGSGMGANGTLLVGAGKDRETLIRVIGKNDKVTGSEVKVTDVYVPVKANKLTVANAIDFKVGDLVIVHRPSTLNWIQVLGTHHFGGGETALGWKPGKRDQYIERRIVAINNNTLTLDVPLTTALDTTYGGGTILKMTWNGRIEKVGIENLQLQSEYDVTNLKDEAHRWMAITMENISDAWVRQVTFKHFAGSAVNVMETAKRVTVEDCKSLAPISEIGGHRRYTFITTGQQTLFQRCYAENGYHDFAVGFMAPGPNAFVQCQSVLPYSFSGTIDSWASGVLFDIVNVDGNAIRFGNRSQDANGAGWSAANSVIWQSTAARIDIYNPPTANNYAFGNWAQFSGDGYWESSNEHIQPRSLFYAQLAERIGDTVTKHAQFLPIDSEASSSPPYNVAMALTAKAAKPAPLLSDWIDASAQRNPIPVDATGAKTIDQIGLNKVEVAKAAPAMQIKNGWLVRGDAVITGRRQEVPWWSGSINPKDLPNAKPHITRFVPGRTGRGLTDDLDTLTNNMIATNVVAMDHNYALWYERRRDDHERIRRMDGEVWAPFYELPFQRSGKELAWDGLSKYDLTKYNPWYWNRLKQFADLADQKSLVLIHQNYMQHNIIEAGAHYADFPWRPVNNINNTGFPEPVPYAGDKRLFMAEQFYDVNQPVRRKLHIAYIHQCLNNFKDNSGVIQMISSEYTGPLHFVQFWLDVIKGWEKETGKSEIIGLSTTKDVQDSILADPARAALVDVIDIRYWHYQNDSTTYEPKGGLNLAPRQHARLLKPKPTSFQQVYRAVSEYKQKFPNKAVLYNGDAADANGWAVFMAGGSMAAIPVIDQQFLNDASTMKPLKSTPNQYTLANGGKGYIVYSNGDKAQVNPKAGLYKARWINPRNGSIIKEETDVQGGKTIELTNPGGAAILWLTLK